MRTFFKGIVYLIRYPRGFIETWKASVRKLKAEADPPSPKASAGKGAKRG
jgi:hypothetical protein